MSDLISRSELIKHFEAIQQQVYKCLCGVYGRNAYIGRVGKNLWNEISLSVRQMEERMENR